MSAVKRKGAFDFVTTGGRTAERCGQSKNELGSRILAPQHREMGLGKRIERVLLICYYDPQGISTVIETVGMLQRHSIFPMTVLNLAEHQFEPGHHLKLNPALAIEEFSAIVIHNTVAYNVDNLRSLDIPLRIKLAEYEGVKILMKQDENFRFRETAEYVGATGFDVIFSCLPPGELERIYPRPVVGEVRFERMLTGYVTPALRRLHGRWGERVIDIGYRGSIQPLAFGRLAYEKRSIGTEVARRLRGADVRLDISSRWEDRLGGERWLEFLMRCRATLGAESGASMFDIDGALGRRAAVVEAKLGPVREDEEYAEAWLAEMAEFEGNVEYAQLSPRHFEAAAAGTLQILFPGRYSDRLQAGRHFFELKRDYTNLEEAVDVLRDEKRRLEFCECAYEEVVLDRDNWLEAFVERVDGRLDWALRNRGLERHAQSYQREPARNVLLCAAHEPSIDPRLGWIAGGSPAGIHISQLGVLASGAGERAVAEGYEKTSTWVVPRIAWKAGEGRFWYRYLRGSDAGMAALAQLEFIEEALRLSPREFANVFMAPLGVERISAFRWYLQYFLDTTASLLSHATRLRGLHGLIATDLDTLPACLILKGLFDIPVLYDAHEYWAEADRAAYEFETQFWVDLEARLVRHADARQTVSPGLAELFSSQYGVPFSAIPNAEPLEKWPKAVQGPVSRKGECFFLYLGRFAMCRGIEILIDAWGDVDSRAILLLQGLDGPYKEEMIRRAAMVGFHCGRIRFPEPVSEDALVEAAAQANVGVIPYTPAGFVYRHCSPNKLSQYMAAGIPILANDTVFVRKTVEEARCGVVVDFAVRAQLVDAVNAMVRERAKCEEFGSNGRAYFESRFCWEIVGGPMYHELERLTFGSKPAALCLHEGAVFHGLYGVSKLENDANRISSGREVPAAGRARSPSASIADTMRSVILRWRAEAKKGKADRAWLDLAVWIWHHVPYGLRRRIWSVFAGK